MFSFSKFSNALKDTYEEHTVVLEDKKDLNLFKNYTIHTSWVNFNWSDLKEIFNVIFAMSIMFTN